MKVEILYISGCPNYEPAVEAVYHVLQEEGARADVVEIEVSEARAEQLGFLGSPTIRVDGRDVENATGTPHGCGIACRTYIDNGRRTGVPPSEWIRAAIREALRK